MRRKLSQDVSISEMLTMRQNGLTNKQIADQLEVSVSTVYQYIGRRSEAVKHAAVQGKPCPIFDAPHETVPESLPEPDKVTEENEPVKEETPKAVRLPTNMNVLKESHTYDLQGLVCVFHVDTGCRTVEMKDEHNGTMTGMIDAYDLPAFIRELQEVLAIFQQGATANE